MLENEEFFKAITSSARDGIVLINSFGKIIYWNKAAEKIFYYSSVETLGKDLYLVIVPKQYRETYKKGFEEFVKTGQGFFINKTIELHGLRKDGVIISIELSGSKIELKGKWNAVAIIRDISERKLMEEKLKESKEDLIKLNRELEQKVDQKSKQLKESEERYHLITEKAHDLIGVVNKKYKYEYINKKPHLNILGYTSDDLIGKSAWRLIHPDDVSNFLAVLKGEEKYDEIVLDFRVRHKNCDWIWIQFKGSMFKTENNEGKILLVSRDITMRKRVELKLKDSEEKIRNIMNNISDVLMESNINGTITFISPQIYDLVGYRPNELMGLKFTKFLYPEDRITYYENFMKNSSKAGDKFSMELRVLHRKGYYVPISANGSMMEVNNEFKIFVVIRDITEKRKIDEMMKSEIKKLQELDQIRSDLIRRISHELKTPLVAIFSGSQLLLDYSKDKVNDQAHRIIQLIHMGGYRLKNLVDNLILTYNIESKELNLNLKRKNIIQIIKKCIEDIVFQAKRRKIFITFELLKEIFVEVDESMIKRAISNILSNAVKNTPTNGNIFVSTYEHPNYIDIIIRDDGVGLIKKEKALLFNRFGKLERYGKGMDVDIEGLGLGLFITNEIVKLHFGEIIVKSKGRKKGSTFIIRLPIN